MQIEYRSLSAEGYFIEERGHPAKLLLNDLSMILAHGDDELSPFHHLLRQLVLNVGGWISTFLNQAAADERMNRLRLGLDARRSDTIRIL